MPEVIWSRAGWPADPPVRSHKGEAGLHYTIGGPGISSSRFEFLEFALGWFVNLVTFVSGVNVIQDRHDFRVEKADTGNLKRISIDVINCEAIGPNSRLAESAQLTARPF